MFEREVKYEAFFLPGPEEMDPDEAIGTGLAWLLNQPGTPPLLFHRKKMVGNNTIAEEAARRHRIAVEAPQTVLQAHWPGGSILAPWASDDVLRRIDDDLVHSTAAVCVIGWMPGHATWIAARGAVDLRGGSDAESKEDLVSDLVVWIALDQASSVINHNNALAPPDRGAQRDR